MFTYDEWGNTMLHITTGKEGAEMFKKMGYKNPPKEEYEKHMASYRKIKAKENEIFDEWVNKFLKWCNS